MNLYDIAFYIHLASLAAAVCGVLYADTVGFAWFLGRAETVPSRTLRVLHDTMSVSLGLLILSGLYLFWPMREYLLHKNLFIIKLCFVAALVINSFIIDKLMHAAAKLSFRDISGMGKLVLSLSGALSLLCWAGAGVSAVLLFGVDVFGLYLAPLRF